MQWFQSDFALVTLYTQAPPDGRSEISSLSGVALKRCPSRPCRPVQWFATILPFRVTPNLRQSSGPHLPSKDLRRPGRPGPIPPPAPWTGGPSARVHGPGVVGRLPEGSERPLRFSSVTPHRLWEAQQRPVPPGFLGLNLQG